MFDDNFPKGFGNRRGNRVELRVMGVSYSQIQSGAYALILAEVGGPMRLPVVVGGMEAQSIAIKLEGITPPRPMTHDLFVSLMQAYNFQLVDAFIYKFEDGIFSSELTFIDSAGKEVQLDARTSDAIAIAMRCNVPIFTTREIINETGFTMESAMDAADADRADGADKNDSPYTHNRNALINKLKSLRDALAKAIADEAYEEASRLTREIKDMEARIASMPEDNNTDNNG